MNSEDPQRRFSRRVNDYVKYRPGYPDALVATLRRRLDYDADSVIADVGSGTGISSRFFLERGNVVYGVEPNRDMRSAAEQWLASYAKFHSVEGTAEATTLGDSSVDLVVAAQAFHWFDPSEARAEFARIVKPSGAVVLLWNERKIETTPFLRAYEQLLRELSDDYDRVSMRYTATEDGMDAFFGSGSWGSEEFPNRQSFDLDGLLGRARSSSYVPMLDHPNHDPMMRRLTELFHEYAEDGHVVFEYATRLFWGRFRVSD